MNTQLYALLGLTALVAALVAVLVFAVLRFAAAARDARSRARASETTEGAFMAAAIQAAMGRLREQERATQARAEASERLSSEIVAGLTSGLLLVDMPGTLRMINPAARRLLHLDEGARGKPYREALAAFTPLADVIEEVLASGRAVARRTVVIEGDGERSIRRTHLGVSASPLTHDGSTTGAICLFTDLTAVVELEEQVRLKDSFARVGEMTAGIAHEFRNGLATIHGYARLLERGPLEEREAACVRGIRDETAALGEIVDAFLNFARPASLTVSHVALDGVVQRVATDARSELGERPGTVETTGRFGAVEGDETMLRQALANVVRNGIQACVEAGIEPRIVVSGSVDPAARQTRIVIADNGPGIPAEARARLFRPFSTSRPRGTGLGLALVQKIVVTHNGRVQALTPPTGAAFEICLPLAPGETVS